MSKHACNLISRINDGYKRKLLYVDVLTDSTVSQLLNFLLKHGFIQGFFQNPQYSYRIRVFLKLNGIFENSLLIRPFVTGGTVQINTYVYKPFRKIEILSHGGHNIYVKAKHIKKQYMDLNNIIVLSTPLGIMTAKEAYIKKVGGKVCFRILL